MDPLLNCVGSNERELKKLMDYCDKYQTHSVLAVRDYSTTKFFSETAPLIQANAQAISEQIRSALSVLSRISTPVVDDRKENPYIYISITSNNRDYIYGLKSVVNDDVSQPIRISSNGSFVCFDRAWIEQVARHSDKAIREFENNLGVERVFSINIPDNEKRSDIAIVTTDENIDYIKSLQSLVNDEASKPIKIASNRHTFFSRLWVNQVAAYNQQGILELKENLGETFSAFLTQTS